jgi:hypothetical protein
MSNIENGNRGTLHICRLFLWSTSSRPVACFPFSREETKSCSINLPLSALICDFQSHLHLPTRDAHPQGDDKITTLEHIKLRRDCSYVAGLLLSAYIFRMSVSTVLSLPKLLYGGAPYCSRSSRYASQPHPVIPARRKGPVSRVPTWTYYCIPWIAAA